MGGFEDNRAPAPSVGLGAWLFIVQSFNNTSEPTTSDPIGRRTPRGRRAGHQPAGTHAPHAGRRRRRIAGVARHAGTPLRFQTGAAAEPHAPVDWTLGGAGRERPGGTRLAVRHVARAWRSRRAARSDASSTRE